MKTTVYEIENGQQSWMWDSCAENADLRHLEMAFGKLARLHPERYYEVEQDGKLILTIRQEKHDDN
jgi:hypothetical protein